MQCAPQVADQVDLPPRHCSLSINETAKLKKITGTSKIFAFIHESSHATLMFSKRRWIRNFIGGQDGAVFNTLATEEQPS